MKLFSFLRGFGKSQVKDYTPSQWTVLTGGVESAENNLLHANKEWVFIAANRIATSVAGVRFKVMRYQKNGDDQEIFEGPMVDFLDTPAKNFTGKDFIYLNTFYKELTGNAFWERNGRELLPLVPTLVQPIITGGKLTGYKYNEGPSPRTIPLKNMLHDRYVDPARPYWGVGKLAKIARWVDTSMFANEFLRRFFINGATFGGFIETEEETEQRINLIKLGLKNDHVGVENAHKIGVLPKGSKYAKTTSNMSEIEMGATDDRYRDKILAGFGVPKSILGIVEDVNRANAEASEYTYAKYTIKPIADDLIEFLNNNIAPIIDTSDQYYFAYDDFIPVNRELDIREKEASLAKQPYKTVNEVRAEEGLPPVSGGDVIYGNPFQVPLGQPAPSPHVPDTEPDEDAEPKKAVPKRLRAPLARERKLDAVVSKIATVITAHNDPDEAAHKKFVARIDAHEKILANKVRDFNNRQERDVILNLSQITKGVAKGDLFDMDGEVAILIDFVSPILKGLMLEQAIEEYKAQLFPGTFDSERATITRAIELASKRLARSYNNTTALLLKKALNDGIRDGDDITQLAGRVKEIYEFSDQVRADAVARTESVYIANEGSREAYRQSGVVKTVRWYTAEDERVCEWCGPMNGKIIGINEVFFKKGETVTSSDGQTMQADYRAIDVPPLHTNCRCLIRAEEIDIS